MKKRSLWWVIATVLVCCAYPKDPVNIPFDNALNEVGGFTTRAEIVPMTVCVVSGDQYEDELRQLVDFSVAWWNGYLERRVGCPVFVVDPRNDTALFCDVLVKTGVIPPEISGINDGWWSRRSDPPGLFYKSEITLDNSAFRRPDYLKGVMVHELGHCFGLADDPGAEMRQLGSVMSSPLPREYRPTFQDLNTIVANARCEE